MKIFATAAVVMFFASWTGNLMAEQRQSQGGSGIIHFSGMIVESQCTHEVQKKQIQVSCERDGQAKSSHVSFTNAAVQPLPYNVGTSQIRWLDRQHKLGILTVDYR